MHIDENDTIEIVKSDREPEECFRVSRELIQSLSFDVSVSSLLLINPNITPDALKLFLIMKGIQRNPKGHICPAEKLSIFADFSMERVNSCLAILKEENVIDEKGGVIWF